jgi:hypothetical protein
MTNCTALSNTGTSLLSPVTTSLENLPARLGKRLWVTPAEFLQTTCAMQVAHWAVNLFPRSLPDSHRRGRKRRYSDESILLVAYIQSAWQMSYEMVVDYFRNHPEAAKQAGFEDGQVISVGQYWERRRALGIWVFWLFFVGMVWQLDSIHNNTEMFLSLSFHECSGCYCRQPTLSNLQIGKSTHGAKSLFVHVQMTAKTIHQNVPVLSSGDGMFHSHAHSSNGAVAFFLFRRQFTALRFLGWRVHSQARNCLLSVAISIRYAFLRRYMFVQALIPFVCIGVYSFRQAFNHPRWFSQLDVSQRSCPEQGE